MGKLGVDKLSGTTNHPSELVGLEFSVVKINWKNGKAFGLFFLLNSVQLGSINQALKLYWMLL